jgi:hypothetical protein
MYLLNGFYVRLEHVSMIGPVEVFKQGTGGFSVLLNGSGHKHTSVFGTEEEARAAYTSLLKAIGAIQEAAP